MQRLKHTSRALRRAQRWTEAAALYARQVERLRRKLPADHPDLADALYGVGVCRLKAGDPTAAEAPLRECSRIDEQRLPDHWQRFNGIAYLGESLHGQKKYAEAEPLLLAGYEGMKQREAKIPAERKVRLTESLERLVQLYEATGDKTKAELWRAKKSAEKTK
jgi:TolA-binding protein